MCFLGKEVDLEVYEVMKEKMRKASCAKDLEAIYVIFRKEINSLNGVAQEVNTVFFIIVYLFNVYSKN